MFVRGYTPALPTLIAHLLECRECRKCSPETTFCFFTTVIIKYRNQTKTIFKPHGSPYNTLRKGTGAAAEPEKMPIRKIAQELGAERLQTLPQTKEEEPRTTGSTACRTDRTGAGSHPDNGRTLPNCGSDTAKSPPDSAPDTLRHCEKGLKRRCFQAANTAKCS